MNVTFCVQQDHQNFVFHYKRHCYDPLYDESLLYLIYF